MYLTHDTLKRADATQPLGGYSVAGRTHRTFNPARSNPHRGFESHPALYARFP